MQRACNCAMSLPLHLPLHCVSATSCGDLPLCGASQPLHLEPITTLALRPCYQCAASLPLCRAASLSLYSKAVTAQQALYCTSIILPLCGCDPATALRVYLRMQQPVTALWL